MAIPQTPSPLSAVLAAKTYNAAWFSGSTIEQQITNAIAAAAADGALYVFVPSNMLPYNASLVTFNINIRVIREGSDPRVFDVRAYGAAGDGITDDTVAINAAIAGAAAINGIAEVTDGVYVLATYTANVDSGFSAIKIDATMTLRGKGNAWLKYSDATGNKIIVRVNSNPAVGQISDVVIENLGFDGNNFQIKSGAGLQLMNCKNPTVRGCKFTGFGATGGGITPFSYALRAEGFGIPAAPYVWTNASPSGFTVGARIEDNAFYDFQRPTAPASPNAIFCYQTDGTIISRNVIRNTGLGIMIYGPNRRATISTNIIEDIDDEGIRIELHDVIQDYQQNREHTITGNVIRHTTVEGIRLNGSRTMVVGNVCSWNGNSGIKSDAGECNQVVGNICNNNANRGIYLSQASVAGQGGHRDFLIANNYIESNGGTGIHVQGGSDTHLVPDSMIVIQNNIVRLNGFGGIELDDCDSKCKVIGNTCEQNGDGGVTFFAGIALLAVGLDWGGATIAFNRCFDTTAAPNAKQPVGIRLSANAGRTLSKNYLYFNDCSDAQNSAAFFATAVSTTYTSPGTVQGQYIRGTLYRNITRGVNRTAVGVNLSANDVIVEEDETGTAVFVNTGRICDNTQTFAIAGAGAIAPDLSLGSNLEVTLNGATATINNPTNMLAGQMVTVELFNNSGGASVVTWGGGWLGSAQIVVPATTKRRISLWRTRSNGTQLILQQQTGADI